MGRVSPGQNSLENSLLRKGALRGSCTLFFHFLLCVANPALKSGEAFLLAVGAFLLTVKLLCLQFLQALIRRTFPL